MRLDDLGPRICIVGPSNSGKSTLAARIGRVRVLDVVHLDRLYHHANTDWEPRPIDEFVALHDEAIARERWVIDGNYAACMPQRLARATGLIRLDISTARSLARYLRRTLFERTRVGALDGGRDSVKWDMLKHIVVASRANRARYGEIYARAELPKLQLSSAREITGFYAREGLCTDGERASPASF